jgi:hypothetical protein
MTNEFASTYIDGVGEHGSGQEEGDVCVDVEFGQHVVDSGQAGDVFLHGETGREKGSELH